MGKLTNKTVQARSKLRMIKSKTRQRFQQKVKHPIKCLTRFDDLPNEILLRICHYLNPVHVLQAFFNYDDRMFSCISDYHNCIHLTQYSYTDVQLFLILFTNKQIRPSTLSVSNARIPTLIEMFADACNSSTKFHFDDVRHLSLLECTQKDLDNIDSYVKKFSSLQSLRIVESATLDENQCSVKYSLIEKLRELMFHRAFDTLTELELSITVGIVLDKRLYPNEHLTRLTIWLHKIDDLFVLFDGLTPNLIVLDATVSQSDICQRSPMPPRSWPRRFMSHLFEFRLRTSKNVAMTFDHLRGIVMPLNQLEKFTLDVEKWISNDQQFVNGNQIDMLIRQYMPRLRQFHCSIESLNDIDMQTFATLSERWPMTCGSVSESLSELLYTVPWPIEQLGTSMLADNDTVDVCPNVRDLVVEMPGTNLSRRFPNIDTLTIILPGCEISREDYVGFRRLRHLIAFNIMMIPFLLPRHIHTLTLFEANDLLYDATIYPHVKHLILKKDQIYSLNIVISLVQHFPNLRSLEIQLQPNAAEYHASLQVLLDGEYLPHLSLLKTNWIANDKYCSNIQIWISDQTPLKWKSTPFYGHHDDKCLTICL